MKLQHDSPHRQDPTHPDDLGEVARAKSAKS